MYEDLAGCYARSTAGHDKGTVYIIINVEAEYIFLSDGRIKTVDHPKKKKRKHIQVIKQKDDTIESRLKADQKIMNEDIKLAIKNYIAKQGGLYVKGRCN